MIIHPYYSTHYVRSDYYLQILLKDSWLRSPSHTTEKVRVSTQEVGCCAFYRKKRSLARVRSYFMLTTCLPPLHLYPSRYSFFRKCFRCQVRVGELQHARVLLNNSVPSCAWVQCTLSLLQFGSLLTNATRLHTFTYVGTWLQMPDKLTGDDSPDFIVTPPA